MDILLDPTLNLAYFIPSDPLHEVAKKVMTTIEKHDYTVWIDPATVTKLQEELRHFADDHKLEKDSVQLALEVELKDFLKRSRIFSLTGYSVRKVLSRKDFPWHYIAIYKNYKRVARRGIVISHNEKWKGVKDDVLTPEEFSDRHEKGLYPPALDKVPLLDLSRRYRRQQEEIDQALLDTLVDGQYVLGTAVGELEQAMAKYLGVQNCVGTSSGTDALLLALRALAIHRKGREMFSPEDEVITSPLAFVATGEAILRSGATPVFVDIDRQSYNLDPEKVKAYLETSDKVVGILPVHLFGRSCQMDALKAIADEKDLFLVEDACQALGGMWQENKLGTVGDIGCYSFSPSKNLAGFGDGGMLATNDDQLAETVGKLIQHGGEDKYNSTHIGYNFRLDTLQASTLLVKLPYLDEYNARRRTLSSHYDRVLADIEGLEVPLPLDCDQSDFYHVFHQYTVRIANSKRDDLRKHLEDKGVQAKVYYPKALHQMKIFQDRGKTSGALAEAEKATQEVLSLPIEPLYGRREAQLVSEAIKSFFEG